MYTSKTLRKIRKILYHPVRSPKILIVRNDGLGDLILTLPLVASIRKAVPTARIYLMTHTSLQTLGTLLPDLEGVVADPGCLLKRHRKGKPGDLLTAQERQLRDEIRAHNFDIAIFAYAESRSAKIIHSAGIPWRVGTGRRLFSWRFNVRNPLSRKRSRMAESWHNLQMLRYIGLSAEYVFPEIRLNDSPEEVTKPYIVLHPYKRNGTALAWSLQNFTKLAEKLLKGGYRVILVGDHVDEEILKTNFAGLLKNKETELNTGLTIRQLFILLRSASAFIGNSSGPLHLAALAQIPHVGFFPQNRTSSPSRWRTLKSEKTIPINQYLLASKFPMNCITCIGPKCQFFNCVDSISVDSVMQGLSAWGVPAKAVLSRPKKQSTGEQKEGEPLATAAKKAPAKNQKPKKSNRKAAKKTNSAVKKKKTPQ